MEILMEQVGQMGQMNQMAAERYLLGELPDDLRDSFEEHMFDCPECAFDIRSGVAFIDEAKVQLPGLTAAAPKTATDSAPSVPRRSRFGWWRSLLATPAFAAPVFATLLLVVGYQNLVTYPALRSEMNEPRLLPVVALHAGTRGSRAVITADRKEGVLLQIDMPEGQRYPTYGVDLYDPQGKLAWSRSFSGTAAGADAETLSLVVPGAGLQAGAYALAISGIDASGKRTELQRTSFDIQLQN
jgi:hypothetical protein